MLSIAITFSGGYLMALVVIPGIIYCKYNVTYKDIIKYSYYQEFLQLIGGKDQ
jgi:hypothetical protein